LERDALLALWQDGVPLGHAWEGFADEWSATRYRELQRTHSHLGLKRLLKLDLIARLYAGELKAIGIEGASDTGPILIPQYYFSKTAEIDCPRAKSACSTKCRRAARRCRRRTRSSTASMRRMVNGPALKALIEEEFSDGIMSAIDFDLEIDRLANSKGDRVRLVMSGKFLPYKYYGAEQGLPEYGFKEE
jgi:Cyanate lyase C-terminal domain